MRAFLGAVCVALSICTVSADLSKFYKGGEDDYDDYEYYDEDDYGESRDILGIQANYDRSDSKAIGSSDNNGRSGQGQYGDSENGFSPKGGIDFDGCENDPDTGRCCITKEKQISTLKKDPILECTHKDIEQCHYTYVTQFRPTQQEICEETFEKQCSISFLQKATNDTVQKCYKPLVKVCGEGRSGQQGRSGQEDRNGQLGNYVDEQEQYGRKRRRLRFKKDTRGNENKKCTTFFESSCTTKYVEKSPGKFVADTSCEKLPVELCGQGCHMEPGEEECHDKVVVSIVDVPEEVCDLNPMKTCRFATKLVPHLSPTHECTVVPKEVCVLKFSTPQEVQKPLITKWCLDPSEPEPSGDSYDEENAKGSPIGPSGQASSNKETVISARNEQRGSQRKHSESSGFDVKGSSNDIYPVAERNYAAPKRGGNQATYGDAGDSLEKYAPNEQAGDEYDSPNTATNKYNNPRSETLGDGATTTVDDTYGAPTNAANDYGAPTNVADDYGAPNNAGNAYDAPANVAKDYDAPTNAADDYGAPTNTANAYGAKKSSGDTQGNSKKAQELYSPPNEAKDTYGAPSSAEESYGAPSNNEDNNGATNAAADNYGAPNTAENIYGAPPPENGDQKKAIDNYGAPDEVNDNYGAPNTVNDEYGAPNTVNDNYGAPDKRPGSQGATNSAADAYGAPNSGAGDAYGAPSAAAADTYGGPDARIGETYGAPSTAGDNYGAPGRNTGNEYMDTNTANGGNDYESESLGTYGKENPSKENYGAPSSIQESEENQSYKSKYQIDNGFGTEQRYDNVGSSDNLGTYGNDLGTYGSGQSLGRYLTPPNASRRSKSNRGLQKKKRRNKNQKGRRSKQSNNRIRSVHPYYYV